MAQCRNKFVLTRVLLSFMCLFFAGSAYPQMISTQVNAGVGNAQVNSGADSNSRSPQVAARADTGQQLSGVQSSNLNSDSSVALSQKMFDGGLEAFSAKNSGGNHTGLGSWGSGAAFSVRGTETTKIGPTVRKPAAQSRAGVFTVGVASISGSSRGPRVSKGQFPDTTRDIFWPSPRLYRNADPFSFRPNLSRWSPDFMERRHLNPTYLVHRTALQGNGHKLKERSRGDLETNEQRVAPLSRLNTTINSGLSSGLSKNALGDALKDPLASGN